MSHFDRRQVLHRYSARSAAARRRRCDWAGMRRALLFLPLLSGCASGPPEADPPTAPVTQTRSPYQTHSSPGRDAVERAPIAPLFFGTAQSGEGSVVTAGPHFYAVSVHRDGHSLALHGVDQVHAQVLDEGATEVRGAPNGANSTVRGRPATILVNEGIRSVAWEEDGAFWSVECECDRPFDDPRCTQDAYLLREADALVSLRGAR